MVIKNIGIFLADENSVILRAPGILRHSSDPELNIFGHAGICTFRHPFKKQAIWPKTPDLGE